MSHQENLYFVAIAKGGYICSLEAGPFIEQHIAEAIKFAMENNPNKNIGGSCHYVLAKTELRMTIVGDDE